MHHQPIKNNMVGLLILLLGIVYPIGIQAGSNEQVKQMILDDSKKKNGSF